MPKLKKINQINFGFFVEAKIFQNYNINKILVYSKIVEEHAQHFEVLFKG